MPKRVIKRVEKDNAGNIEKVGDDYGIWGPLTVEEVVDDIESQKHEYFTRYPDGIHTSKVVIVESEKGKTIACANDGVIKNNLNNLPDNLV